MLMPGANARPSADRVERREADEVRLAALVREAQAGEPLAFTELYLALFDRVHRWLELALGDREDARDAAQQVFLRAFEALPGYTETSGFRSWVFSIARNLAYDRTHAACRSTLPMDPTVLSERRDRLSARMQEATDHAASGGIQALIEDLPATQQRVLTLRYVSDMAPSDIAEVLAISVDAVRHVQHRALRSLGRSLRPRA